MTTSSVSGPVNNRRPEIATAAMMSLADPVPSYVLSITAPLPAMVYTWLTQEHVHGRRYECRNIDGSA